MSEHDKRTLGTSPGHEPLAVSIKAVALATVGIVLLVAVSIAAMRPLTRLLSPSGVPEEAAGRGQVPGEVPPISVGLNPNQAQERLAHEEAQRQWLSEYAWLDDEERVARIPIERAIQIFQEQGLAGATAPASSSTVPQSSSIPDESPLQNEQTPQPGVPEENDEAES